jgi:hypothetical protein
MGPLEGLIPTSATKKPGWQRVLKGKGKRQPTRPEPARHTGRNVAHGGCCAKPVTSIASTLCNGRLAGARPARRSSIRDLEQGGNLNLVARRDPATGETDPYSCPLLVPSRTLPAVDLVCAGRCLCRMRGMHVRFYRAPSFLEW